METVLALTPKSSWLDETAFRRELRDAGFSDSEIYDEIKRVRKGAESAVVARVDGKIRLYCGESRPYYGTPAPRPRDAITNRATCYEVVMVLPGKDPRRVGFTARPSRMRFVGYAREHADEILPFLADDDRMLYSAKRGLRLGPVSIRLSGRTERECADEECATSHKGGTK